MFISNAYAQAAAGSTGEMSTLMTFAPFILIFVIMYFLIIRPNRNREKQRLEMLNSIRRGDMVVTEGGIFGRVTKVLDNKELEVEIAENTRVRVALGKIANVEAKGQPVATMSKVTAKTRSAKKSSKKVIEKAEKIPEKIEQTVADEVEKNVNASSSEEKTKG